MIDVMWTAIGTLASYLLGYLPAVKLGMGSENEPAVLYRQVNRWVYSKKWRFGKEAIDIAKILQNKPKPSILYIAGINDKVLGNPSDVKRLINETGGENYQYMLLSKENGNLRNYGHIDMLTAKECTQDHFPKVCRWLKHGRLD